MHEVVAFAAKLVMKCNVFPEWLSETFQQQHILASTDILFNDSMVRGVAPERWRNDGAFCGFLSVKSFLISYAVVISTN